ncbi:MAG: molybdate ABC transporter substrate-binding protein [ANME-2 cluster archaeon]|nr:molybdate ABC transporter substrate-binding protein [ANME-2 cluster archaeon]
MVVRTSVPRKKSALVWPVLVLLIGVIGIISVSISGCTEQNDMVITVSAASSLQQVFDGLGPEFEQAEPGVRVTMNYASSGVLCTQIKQGAPVDVYVSALEDYMDGLQEQGLIMNGSRRVFAANSLVIIVPKGGETDATLENLDTFDRIAIGDPSHVPAGKFPKESLENSGTWEDVKDNLVYGSNVKQVLNYVARDEVDAGFVYLTDITGQVRVSQSIPDSFHSPIVYTIAVTASSDNPEIAGRFVEMVASDEYFLEQSGFIPTTEV